MVKKTFKARRIGRRALLFGLPFLALILWGCWMKSWRPVEFGHMPADSWICGLAAGPNGEFAAVDLNDNLLIDGKQWVPSRRAQRPVPNGAAAKLLVYYAHGKVGRVQVRADDFPDLSAPLELPREAIAVFGDVVVGCNYESKVESWSVKTGKRLSGFSLNQQQIVQRTKAAKSVSNLEILGIIPRAIRVNMPSMVQITALSFSPDGKLLAGGTGVLQRGRPALGQITLWDTTSHQVVGTLERYNDRLCGVAFSPNGKQLAGLSDNGCLALWQLSPKGRGGTLLRTSFPSDGVGTGEALAWSLDGRLLGVLCAWKLLLIDPQTLAIKRILQAPKGIFEVAFSPDGSMVYTGNGDGSIWRWRLR